MTVAVLGEARPPAKTQWPSASSRSLNASMAAIVFGGAPVGVRSLLLRTPLPQSDNASRICLEELSGMPVVKDPRAKTWLGRMISSSQSPEPGGPRAKPSATTSVDGSQSRSCELRKLGALLGQRTRTVHTARRGLRPTARLAVALLPYSARLCLMEDPTPFYNGAVRPSITSWMISATNQA